MTNWILIAGLGLGAYIYLNRSRSINIATQLDPLDPGVPIQLQPSNGVYEVPTYAVKKYGLPDYTTADTLYVPTPTFSTMPVDNTLALF